MVRRLPQRCWRLQMREALHGPAARDEHGGHQLQRAEALQAAEAGEEHDDEDVRRHDHRPGGHGQQEERLVLGPQRRALHQTHGGERDALARRRRGARLRRVRGRRREAVAGDGEQRRRPRLHAVHEEALQEDEGLDDHRGAAVGEERQRQRVRETHLLRESGRRPSQRGLHHNRHRHGATPPRQCQPCRDPEVVHVLQRGIAMTLHVRTNSALLD
mmetsp:Transcript_5276/g.15222  ORF Transcript_5276/g.15222 Transcript_5276/m.15222 type:complete len:216 (-) Transcript_5276:32-679(-)